MIRIWVGEEKKKKELLENAGSQLSYKIFTVLYFQCISTYIN